MTTTTLTPIKPATQFLSERDRAIISQIINVAADQIVAIWIDCGTVWVKLIDGRLPFDRDWFAVRVAEVKAAMLADEVHQASSSVVANALIFDISWAMFAIALSFNSAPNKDVEAKVQKILKSSFAAA
ncbi:hypothetical protein ACWATR_38285 [Nostoc sp. UIC 10890]